MIIKKYCRQIIFTLFVFLVACVSTDKNQTLVDANIQWLDHDFSAEGKMAIRYPRCDEYRGCKQEAYSASFVWHHFGDYDQVTIYDPLGQEVSELVYQKNLVTIEDSNGTRTISQDEMADNLGFALPIQKITNWVFTLTNKTEFEAKPWQVELKQWQKSQYYRMVTLKYDQYYLRILINSIKK